ncbi:MAG: ABC-F family ATP-binding cassette domain-containing protein [Paracoccaceae bacterium]
MINLSDLRYSIEGKLLFDGASAIIPTGHKVGFVGRNGTGKTTLFKLILEEINLDSGTITIPRNSRIGGVSQEVPSSSQSLLETVLEAHTERAELIKEAENCQEPARISEIQNRLTDINAWSAEARASSILAGLGFTTEEQLRPCSDFSGGWRMRVALAGILFSEPDILLLDEPTNYLDLEGSLWLEQYLSSYPHTVIIISHDRELLNKSVNSILHLTNKNLKLYSGTYDSFSKQVLSQRMVLISQSKKQETRKAHLQSFVDRFRAKATKAKQAQSRLKMLDKMEPITLPDEAAKISFKFPEPEELSPPIIRVEETAVGYGGKPVLKNLDLRIDQDDRIALLGKNGEGKSTLAKLLSGRLLKQSGSFVKSSKLRVGFFAQHQVDELNLEQTPLEHIKPLRQNFEHSRLRALLAGFGIGPEQADTKVGKLSGGQKARLSIMLATIDAPHLLILDEPTNHLDIESRESLVEALTSFSGAIILVSHDMHLLSLVADRLWLVKDGRVNIYRGDLQSYKNLLLETPKKEPKKTKKRKKNNTDLLNIEIKKCETRIAKLTEMQNTLSSRLADPKNYKEEMTEQRLVWQRKYSEVMDALEIAEKLWIKANEKLEQSFK